MSFICEGCEPLEMEEDFYNVVDEKKYRFDTRKEMAKHLRKEHNIDVRVCNDSHGHEYYCMSCGSRFNDHRSFNSDQAMMNHVKDQHGVRLTCSYHTR